jgi:hypothetical protein
VSRFLLLASAFLLFAQAAAAQSYSEQVDTGATLALAQTANQPSNTFYSPHITGNISETDADVYRVWLRGNMRPTLCRASSGQPFAARLFLADAEGNLLAGGDGASARCPSSSLTEMPALKGQSLIAGWYYVGICVGNCSWGDGALQITDNSRVAQSSSYRIDFEPTNVLTRTAYVNTGGDRADWSAPHMGRLDMGFSVVKGELRGWGDSTQVRENVEIFAVDLPAGELALSTLGFGGYFSAQPDHYALYLIDAGGAVLGHTLPGQRTLHHDITAGTYYVGVCDKGSPSDSACRYRDRKLYGDWAFTDTVSYAVGFRLRPSVHGEAQGQDAPDMPSHALPVASTPLIRGTLSTPVDTDVFALDLAPGRYRISLCTDGGTTDLIDSQLFVFNFAGFVQARANDSQVCPNSQHTALIYDVGQSDPSRHFVGVCSEACSYSYVRSGGTSAHRLSSSGVRGLRGGEYTLAVTRIGDVTPEYYEWMAIPGVFDTGQTLSSAHSVGSSQFIVGELDPIPDDVDIYAVSLNEGAFSFSTCNGGGVSPPAGNQLFLVDPLGRLVVEPQRTVDCGGQRGAEISYRVSDPGTYYLGICTVCAYSNGGAYSTVNGNNMSEPYRIVILSGGQGGGIEAPVDLDYIRAEPAGGDVRLTWTTTREQGLERFHVERQAPADSMFATVGSVEAAGFSSDTLRYSFVAPRAAEGYHRFRLRFEDQFGNRSFSDEVVAAVLTSSNERSAASAAMLSVYPNPTAGAARVAVHLGTAEEVRVAVYDLLGREVARLHDGLLQAGEQMFALEAGPAPGVYLVRAAADSFALTTRLVVVR